MPHLTSCIILLCFLSEIGCAESRQIKRDDHGLRPQSRNAPDRLSQRSNVHLDLDYSRLLESFGISENGSDIEKNQESMEPVHRKTKDLETGRCQILQCDHGRVCRINIQTGVEECICRKKRCSSRYNPVCGSDGKWYHNHCSLHRASCIEDHPVHIVDPPGKHCDQQTTTQSPKETALSTRIFIPEACSVRDYAEFKSKLLLHFYDRFLPFGVPGTQSSIAQREILRDIWDILDGNKDNVLDQKELDIRRRSFEFASPCRLDDILRNEDLDGNDQLDFHELLTAYGLGETPSTWPAFPPRKWTAIAGNSIELPCDIIQTSAGINITWERNHVVLNGRDDETGLHINGQTGTLYATHLQLIHSGNYSCFDEQFPDAHQIHHLVVVVQPEVEVEYRERFVRTGQNVSVKCHTAGVPLPTVRWLKNDEPIKNSKNHITDCAGYLRISNVQKSDTAVYKCMAESEAGRSSDSTSLFVMDHDSPNHAAQKLFVVFFAEGISAYDADQCGVQFRIDGTSVIPGTRELLCGNNFAKCEWGSTVNVLDRYIYASQPLLNRVLVLSLQQMLIVQIVHTDNVPVKLNYVPHLDQVWIVCWRSTEDTHFKTIQLVRDASQKLEHSAIHLEPLHGKYQTVSDFFPPPIQELAQNLPYAFASGSDGKSLVKIDMRSFRTIATVDLASNGCRPQKVTYSTIGGFVFVDCVDIRHGTPRGQLVLDYVTNAVLKQDQSISGLTYISPDSRQWVNLGTDVIRIQEIGEAGLVYMLDVVTPLHIADVVFHPSHSNQSYDLYATSLSKDELFLVEINSHRFMPITNIGPGTGRKLNRWGVPESRFIASDGIFGSHVITAAKNSVFVTNTARRHIDCEIGGLPNPQHALWVYRQADEL